MIEGPGLPTQKPEPGQTDWPSARLALSQILAGCIRASAPTRHQAWT